MSATGRKRTLPLTPQTAKRHGMKRWSFVATAGLFFVGGCGEQTALDNLLNPGAIYSQSCSEPRPGWMRPGDSPGNYPLWHHLLIIPVRIEADNSLRWSGNPVSRSALRGYLARTTDLNPPVAVVLRVDAGADCQIVGAIRQDMEELLRCRSSGLCGEGDGEWG